jgi:hypothetical protein
MSGESGCYEFKDDPEDRLTSQNVAAETFFKSIKAELIFRR